MPSADHRRVVLAGHTGDVDTARAALTDPDSATRAAALGALARLDALDADVLGSALGDPDPTVRRRAAEEAARLVTVAVDLLPLTDDPDPTVVEAAAHALGELDPAPPGAVAALERLTQHEAVVVRETAVAALGSRGEGLDAVLRATTDVATVRRRAVLAVAAFEGEAVEEALQRLATDRDRQVRQAAEDLLHGWGS